MSYLFSFFSPKKISHKGISFLGIWDEDTSFTKTSQILPFAKLKHVQLGKFSRIGYNCNVSHTNIGNFTAIGRNCNIGLGQHPTNLLSTRNLFYKKEKIRPQWAMPIHYNECKTINIGNDVWIGLNSIIMDGVSIGDGSVIGAGSIVTKNVPSYAIVAGTPAKIIKYRFNKDIIDHLDNLKWWDFDDEKIMRNLWIFNKQDISLDDLKDLR